MTDQPERRRSRLRAWHWVVVGVAVVGLTGWMVWTGTGPETHLPPGTERISDRKLWIAELALSPNGKRLAYATPVKPYVASLEVLDLTTRQTELIMQLGRKREPPFPFWLSDEALGYVESSYDWKDSKLFLPSSLSTPIVLAGIGRVWQVFGDPAKQTIFMMAHPSAPFSAADSGLWEYGVGDATLNQIPSVASSGESVARASDGSNWVYFDMKRFSYVACDRNLRRLAEIEDPRDLDGTEMTSHLALSPTGQELARVAWRETARSRFFRRFDNPQISGAGIRGHIALRLYLAARVTEASVYNFETQEWTILASFPGTGGEVVWHPDGKHLIVAADHHLWRVPLPPQLWATPAPGYHEPP